MKKMFYSFCLFILFFYSFAAMAGISPELLGAVDHIYNGSFSTAKTTIDSHIAAHPDDPAGYILKGIANEWYQVVRNKGKALNTAIMEDYQKARELATTALEKDKANLELKALLGNAYMYIAKKQLDGGHKVQAGASLKKSKELMLEVVAKDPNNVQAYFAIGLFNYFAAEVPAGFKWLAMLLGFNGDSEKGLSYIKKAITAPNLSQGDALFMLIYIYSQKRGDYKSALVYASQLYNKYPDNHVFLFDLAEMQHRTKDKINARANFTKFFQCCEKNPSYCNQKYTFLANYFMTWSYMDDKDHENAKKYIGEAVKLNTKKYKDRTADLEKWGAMIGK
ncbi:MAG: DUF3808 domain-containing protein [Deltaproteobacteria bacterium]|nr:DUF3808 domain-containing protein [Deltaproteobacteria bacterium]